jgi:hypothetical protein
MNNRVRAIGLALLLVLLVFLTLTGAVHDWIVIPLLYLFWAARLIYLMIPQALLWGAFLLLAAMMIGTRLFHSAPALAAPAGVPSMPGRLTRWVRQIRRAGEDEYERWTLAQQLSQLTVEALAQREQCSPQDVIHRIERGTLDISPELQAYLHSGIATYRASSIPRRYFWQALRQRKRSDQPAALIDRDLLQLITYLEEQLNLSSGDL